MKRLLTEGPKSDHVETEVPELLMTVNKQKRDETNAKTSVSFLSPALSFLPPLIQLRL